MGARPSHFRLTTEGPLRLYSTAELLNLPAPTWLVDRIIPAGGLVALYGPSGCGKSFLAIDIALSIATGRPWQGHGVQPGYVLYIAAEGGTGIGKRAKAWLLAQDVRPSQAEIAWLIESIPVHVDSDEMSTLLERVTQEMDIAPDLVIVDTLARCFDGDENQQEDMGRFVAGVDHLRREFNCTVLVVHHTGWSGERERGNSAFRGACDAMLSVTKDGNDIHIECAKQKDAEPFEPIDLELAPIEDADSCIVVASVAQTRLDGEQAQALEALKVTGPCSWYDWIAASGLPESWFLKHVMTLKKKGLVVKDVANRTWSVVGGIKQENPAV